MAARQSADDPKKWGTQRAARQRVAPRAATRDDTTKWSTQWAARERAARRSVPSRYDSHDSLERSQYLGVALLERAEELVHNPLLLDDLQGG